MVQAPHYTIWFKYSVITYDLHGVMVTLGLVTRLNPKANKIKKYSVRFFLDMDCIHTCCCEQRLPSMISSVSTSNSTYMPCLRTSLLYCFRHHLAMDMFNITACIQSQLRGMTLDKDMVKIYDVAYNNILSIHIILVWF